MTINIIKIPAVEHLSDYPEFDSLLDRGKVIVDKEVCGCGATEYYLRLPDVPVLLLSPRKLLIETKLDGNPTVEEQRAKSFAPHHRPYEVMYFDRSRKTDVNQTIAELVDYLHNPLMLSWFTPKILVTYDSFPLVLQTLQSLGILSGFTIVVDEFNALFTDVKLKGTKELETLSLLESLDNHVVYLSATPIKEQFLAPIPAFANLPYYELRWPPEMIRKVRVWTEPMSGAISKVSEIISEYRHWGYFKSTIVNGSEVFSREAVFFINSVTTILRIIEKNGLTPADTLVLCADDSGNRSKLSALKPSFSIGKPASESEYRTKNKPFTFVTRVCFEGADMYSDNSSTYVFSDCHLDNLNLDLSTDLTQIAGRCRTKTNPFRNDIRLFYKTSDRKLIDETRKAIENRENLTVQMMANFQGITDLNALQVIIDAQKSVKYSKYYIDVEKDPITNTGRVVINELARQADLRALDIKEEQYRTGYTVSAFCQNSNMAMYDIDEHVIDGLWKDFTTSSNFSYRMQRYADTLSAYPHLKDSIERALTDIPSEYKHYYNLLGPDCLRTLAYNRQAIQEELQNQSTLNTSRSEIQRRLYELLPPGYCYSNPVVKQALSTVYAEFRISASPTATDITQYINARQCKFTDKNHKRKNGYKIL